MVLKTWKTAFLIGIGMAIASSAQADDTGLADLHDLRREKGKLCMTDHWHYGNGTGSTHKIAQAAAVSSWASFVDLEYGSDWARSSKAGSRKVSCSQGSEWTCQVEARPCK